MMEAADAAWCESAAVRDHLNPFLEWLLHRQAAQGGLTELRVIGKGVQSAIVGPDDLGDIAEQLAPHVGVANIYFGINPVEPSQHERHPLRPCRSAVKDGEVRAYSLLAIDVDPVRSDRRGSAAVEEKASALEVAARVQDWLTRIGAPPIVADSGNGYHLLVPLVPVTGDDVPQAARDAQTLLRLLDERFSTPSAKIDRS
ncbi:MAG: hypothetical protein AAF211_06900, partial [Myxococcota bacterium]